MPSLRSGGYDLLHAHQGLPDGALAQRLAADLGVPYVVTVHGVDVYQHFRIGGAVERRAKDVLARADAVMANSSAVAGLLAGVVAPERLTVVLNGTTGLGRMVEPAADYLPGEPLVAHRRLPDRAQGHPRADRGRRAAARATAVACTWRSSAKARCAALSPRSARAEGVADACTSSASSRTHACWR